MIAVAIRHLAFEDLGCFEPALAQAGYDVRYHDAGVDPFETLAPAEADLVVVLGGPIGAYERDRYPFLREEIAFLERRLAAAQPTIGICLGAQLMACALGASVHPGPEEIGFAPIALTDEGHVSCLAAFDGGPVLHWHGDYFELPAGAVRLASTPLCENQAFSFGRNVIGFQFHPEAGRRGFERWLVGHAVELAHAGVDVPVLRAAHDGLAPDLARRADMCLAAWLDQVER